MIDTLQSRFDAKVQKTPGCWLWTAFVDSSGYGRIRVKRESLKASRVAWNLSFGEIPSGLCVLHECDNPRCVRPSHLFLGTRTVNNLDKLAKNRGAKGIQLPQAKLTPEKVRTILRRIAAGEPQKVLASDFGVSPTTITEIKQRKIWRHVAV